MNPVIHIYLGKRYLCDLPFLDVTVRDGAHHICLDVAPISAALIDLSEPLQPRRRRRGLLQNLLDPDKEHPFLKQVLNEFGPLLIEALLGFSVPSPATSIRTKET